MATLLPAVLIGFGFAVLLRLLIGRAPLFVRLIPIQVLSIVLIGLEIEKQRASLAAGYDLFHLPFHYCSLMLLFFPLAAFSFGKIGEVLRSVALAIAGTVTVITLIAPETIFPAEHISLFYEHFFSYHTVIFHCLVPVYFFLLLALDLCRIRVGWDLLFVCVTVIGYSVLATKMAWHYETNYSNFLYCKIEALEEKRLLLVAEHGEEATRLIYARAVGAVHLAASLVGYIAGALQVTLWRLLPLGKSARKPWKKYTRFPYTSCQKTKK